MTPRLSIDRNALADFCRRNRIRKLSLFGSVLRDDFRADSDVDMLVEFEAGAQVGYLDMARMEIELSALVGREVDLRTADEISSRFRNRVIASAEVQYAAG
jgi:uncharacterized protein